jgi:hypothetical protein
VIGPKVCSVRLLDLSWIVAAQIAGVKLIGNPKQASHDPDDKEQCSCVHFISLVKVSE